jgi:hypothetical protein
MGRSRLRPRGGLALAAAAGIALLAAAPVAADPASPPPTPPPDHSAIAQYVEQVPTGAGSRVAGIGQPTQTVPEPVREQIQREGGSVAPVLEQMAGSSYGTAPAPAPQAPAPATEPEEAEPEEAEPEEAEPEVTGPVGPSGGLDEGDILEDDVSVVGAAVGAVGGEGGSGRVALLLVLLGGMTAAAVGGLLLARRR